MDADSYSFIEVRGFGLFSPCAPRHESIDDDQRWFDEHPDRSHRLRPMHAGEAPVAGPGSWVCIRQVKAGLRRRVSLIPDFPDSLRDVAHREVFAHALFDTLLKTARTGKNHCPPEELRALIAVLAQLERRGELPKTWRFVTGGGGRRILFRHPGFRIKSTAGENSPLGKGRAEGGYIAALEAAAQCRFERELGPAIITLIRKFPNIVIKENADGVCIKPNGDSQEHRR